MLITMEPKSLGSKQMLGTNPYDIKDQIKFDVFLRIWDTQYQNRQKKWRKINEQAFYVFLEFILQV